MTWSRAITSLDRLGRVPVEKTEACRVVSKYVALLHGREKKQRGCSDYPGPCSFLPAPPRPHCLPSFTCFNGTSNINIEVSLISPKDTLEYSRKPWNLRLTTSRNNVNRPTSHPPADPVLRPLLAIIESSPATEVLKHKPNPVVYKNPLRKFSAN